MLDGPCYLCGQPDRECRESGCSQQTTATMGSDARDLDNIIDGLLFEKKKLLESVQRVDHLVLDVFRLKKQCLDKEQHNGN